MCLDRSLSLPFFFIYSSVRVYWLLGYGPVLLYVLAQLLPDVGPASSVICLLCPCEMPVIVISVRLSFPLFLAHLPFPVL